MLEEAVLVPALQSSSFDQSLTQQLLSEHGQIRTIIAHIQQGVYTKDELAAFASLLEQHIRFEERTYFPEAEKVLDAGALKRVGEQLLEEHIYNCINYPIKFWE